MCRYFDLKLLKIFNIKILLYRDNYLKMQNMSGIIYFKRAFENIALMEAHKYVFNCVIILSVLEISYPS